MKKIKRCIAIMLSLIFALAVCSISASAAEETVIISTNQTYSLSDNMDAYGVYIAKTRTNNSSNSSQRMRAQCHYRTSIFSGWSYDTRVFIGIGSSLSENTYSTEFEEVVTWRLGLSPEVEEDKDVSGNGVIISV